ncbi:MAG: hypothetical protein FWG09_05400 [Synergistaceae bacterium]|nr:hypothetical protein [Synergistaceae bacterium]
MKKIFCAAFFFIFFATVFFASAPAFAAIAQDAQVPRRAGSPLREASVSRAAEPESWIVGMWRRPSTNGTKTACQVFYADGSCFAIGLRDRSYYSGGFPYTFKVIDVTRGKYRLTGSKLEIFDVSGFTMDSAHVSYELLKQYAEDRTKIFNIVNTGSRSEVEELLDPKHALYDTYTGELHEWQNWKNRDDDINIIDADNFETSWPRDDTWGLERVRETIR